METTGLAAHKKNATRLGAHVAFVDESGYLLIPPVRRTWGPRGRTPVIRYSYKHDKISAISTVTVSPARRRLGLYGQFHRKNIQQADVCQFLRHLLRHLRGHVIVIWDNSKPHKGEPIREFCRRFSRVHLERFPAYAPELNPDEGVWSQMDNALANGRPDDLDELSVALNKTLRQLRRSQAKLRWCVHQSELPPFCTGSCITYAEINNGLSYHPAPSLSCSQPQRKQGVFAISVVRFSARTALWSNSRGLWSVFGALKLSRHLLSDAAEPLD